MESSANSSAQSATTLSLLAYSKIFLHAAKYPYGPVAGLVIGKKTADNKFELLDVLPVCHGSPAGPIFDLALLMGDSMREESTVVGLYFSNGLKDTDETPRFVNRISKGISARADYCVVVQLKGTQIGDPTKLAVGITNRGSALSFNIPQTVETVSNVVDQMLSKNCHHRLIDFEDHMGNQHADFRNIEIAQQLSK